MSSATIVQTSTDMKKLPKRPKKTRLSNLIYRSGNHFLIYARQLGCSNPSDERDRRKAHKSSYKTICF